MLVAENFCRECFDACSCAPRIGWKTGFSAGLLKECYAVPSVFNGNLRQEQASSGTKGDDQAMRADFNLFCCDRIQRR